ncbi:LLM class flavin-dependent oxidoreductase [Frankia sp. QA3]|uniref:LLM class flavin-dependent oxidoreductase n=1 Tax=Frankia sp. QA3 TaxID=710111 RepID=UPI000269B85A|nr:LLM class flavin-dependent oxidoreductase [Frankia sp. QA3]EIV90720.1 flavin-dependent oxidoreductase, F420-dependent methylene-tetrahydromethanopterin reductase [Frankia sp. QA3]
MTAPGGPGPFRLGFLTHVHGRGRPVGAVYRELVELFVAGEELGFDGGWIAQHHFSPDYGRLPSPLLLLAAAAQATRRIELGTAVVVLPLEDPIRLAEDAAVLDALSDGRLQLGLGTGGPSAPAFGAFDRDVARRRELFAEARVRLRDLLAGEQIAGTDGLRLHPPAPTLTSRFWDSTTSADGARAAARAGDGLLLGIGPAASAQRPLADVYLAAHRAPAGARLAVSHGVFPGPDRLAARVDLAPDIARFRPYLGHFGFPADLDDGAALDAMNVHHGPVGVVIHSLATNPVGPAAVSYFIAAVQGEAGAAADLGATLRRMELIATEIAPALGWRPAAGPVPDTPTPVGPERKR